MDIYGSTTTSQNQGGYFGLAFSDDVDLTKQYLAS